jgi:hypothetical protein
LAHVHFHFFSFHFHFLLPVLGCFHFVLSLLIEDIFLIEGVDLALDTHLGILVLLGFSLHLHQSSPFHLKISFLVGLLCHPHFVVFDVVVVHYLVSRFLFNHPLFIDVSQLCDVVCFI